MDPGSRFFAAFFFVFFLRLVRLLLSLLLLLGDRKQEKRRDLYAVKDVLCRPASKDHTIKSETDERHKEKGTERQGRER